MKSILFVINTMGMGGGEKAILELLEQIDLKRYEVSLFVLTEQGELINRIPEGVKVVNDSVFPVSVLDYAGKMKLAKTVLKALFVRGILFRRIVYIMGNLWDMFRKGRIQKDKLLWKILSDGAQKLDGEYDLAIAYLEGGSAYYVADYVKAKKKAAFIHTSYCSAGYTRKLDENSYLCFDHIFTVSENVKKEFLSVYPECVECTSVFPNIINREKVIKSATEAGGFMDQYDGFRILSVGRLVPEKAHDIEISAMQILKKSGKAFRWYVLGEGARRKKLEEQIFQLGLKEDFILLGAVNNPYPYFAQCDLYVHAAYLEGRSIAVEEAQILGCAVLASDYRGVHEQVKDGEDGQVCRLDPEAMAESILDLANHPQRRNMYGIAAANRKQKNMTKEMETLFGLLS